MPRKSTGKRSRFEVFKRDYYTCQYCGAQPPGVALVIDHIDPVANGGASTIDNLITACEPCNQGKAARVLGDRAVRPDADLMYLETQQEIAELRRYQAAASERERIEAELVTHFQNLWSSVSGLQWAPAESFIRGLLTSYDPQVVEAALRDVGPKQASGYLTARGGYQPYLRAVAKRMAAASAAASPNALLRELQGHRSVFEVFNWTFAPDPESPQAFEFVFRILVEMVDQAFEAEWNRSSGVEAADWEWDAARAAAAAMGISTDAESDDG